MKNEIAKGKVIWGKGEVVFKACKNLKIKK